MASRSAGAWSATVSPVPSASSSAFSSTAAGASPPPGPSITMCAAPSAARQRATWAAGPSAAPVMSTVPRGFQMRRGARPPIGSGISRRPYAPAGRSAASSSPQAPVSRAHSRRASRLSGLAGRSTNPPQRSGCSRAATLPSPHSWAWWGASRGSESSMETAPRVAHHRGAGTAASTSAWSRVSVPVRPGATPGRGGVPSSRASSDSTPVGGVSSAYRERSSAARPSRSVSPSSSSRYTWPPSAPSARTQASVQPSEALFGWTTSQEPAVVGAVSGTGRHSTRWRQESTAERSRRPRRHVESAGSTVPSEVRWPVPSGRFSVSESAPRSSPSTAAQNRDSSSSAGDAVSKDTKSASQYRSRWKA